MLHDFVTEQHKFRSSSEGKLLAYNRHASRSTLCHSRLEEGVLSSRTERSWFWILWLAVFVSCFVCRDKRACNILICQAAIAIRRCVLSTSPLIIWKQTGRPRSISSSVRTPSFMDNWAYYYLVPGTGDNARYTSTWPEKHPCGNW